MPRTARPIKPQCRQRQGSGPPRNIEPSETKAPVATPSTTHSAAYVLRLLSSPRRRLMCYCDRFAAHPAEEIFILTEPSHKEPLSLTASPTRCTHARVAIKLYQPHAARRIHSKVHPKSLPPASASPDHALRTTAPTCGPPHPPPPPGLAMQIVARARAHRLSTRSRSSRPS